MNFVYEIIISYTKFVYEIRLRAISYPWRRNSYIRIGFETNFVYTKWLLRRNFVYELLKFVYEFGLRRISYRRNEIRIDELLGDEFRLPAIRIRIWIPYTKLWLGAILNRIGADGRASAPGNCNFARFCKRNGRFSPKGGAGLRIAISQGFISEMERFLILADPPGHSNFARFYK